MESYTTFSYYGNQNFKYIKTINLFFKYVKENFNLFFLLHNNTIKTISNTAKSSVLIVIPK